MDLRPYGIKHTVTSKGTVNIPLEAVQHVEFVGADFEFPTDSYRTFSKLGEGTYGITYGVEAVRSGGRYALKVQKFKDAAQAQNILQEAMINILLAEESSTQPHGPYVPRVYNIGYHVGSSSILIVMEMMHGTLWNLIGSAPKKLNDELVPQALIQIAHVMEFFQKRLHMNHRDLKSDNIMYVTDPATATINFKLIDFGLACLDYKGIYISGTDIFPAGHVCERRARDLSQLIMELLLDFADVLSEPLKKALEELVVFKVHDKSCALDKYCPHVGMASWINSYEFLNRSNVENPHATPAALRKAMETFQSRAEKIPKRRKTQKRKRPMRS